MGIKSKAHFHTPYNSRSWKCAWLEQDELPVKKSVDNAFEGRDERGYMPVRAVTERKENRTLREKRESRLWRRAPLRHYQWRPLPTSLPLFKPYRAKRFAPAKRLPPSNPFIFSLCIPTKKCTRQGAFSRWCGRTKMHLYDFRH